MKKSTKLISIILSCLLLIGAAVGITVAADEATEGAPISIEGFNLSYEGAVKVAYYVSNRELAEGESVVLFTSAENFENIPYEAKDAEGYDVCAEFDTVTVDDIAYSVFYSEGAKTAELRRDIYAVAAIVDASGAVVAHTEVEAYSPYAYAMNRFDGEYTEDQAELYTALLDYGAAVQKVVFSDADGVLDEVALAAAGGWADAYYVVTEQLIVNGEATADAADVEYRGADYPDGLSVVADKYLDGNKSRVFVGFTDLAGESLYDTAKYYKGYNKYDFKLGKSVCVYNYADANGAYVTYDEGDLASNGVISALPTVNEGVKWAYLDGDENNGYIEYGKIKTGEGASIKLSSTATETVGKVGDYYIAEFDINVSNTGNLSKSTHIGQFWIDGKKGNDFMHLFGINVYGNTTEKNEDETAVTDGYFTLHGDGGALNGVVIEGVEAKYNEWHNVRIEYYTNLGELYTQLVKLYFDGVLIGEFTDIYSSNTTNDGLSTKNVQYASTLAGVQFNLNSASTGTSFKIDNAFIGAVEKDFLFGQGYYANMYGAQDFEDVVVKEDLGWKLVYGFGNTPTTYEEYAGDASANKTGYPWTVIEQENGNSTVNLGKVNNFYADKAGATSEEIYLGAAGHGGWSNNYQFAAAENNGDVFVLEMDIRFNFANKYYYDNNNGKFGENGWVIRPIFKSANGNILNNVYFYYNHSDDTIRINSTTGNVFCYAKEWVNLRLEYVPNGVDANGNYIYKYTVYANGTPVAAANGNSAAIDNTNFDSVLVETRGWNLDSSISIDNLFVSAVGSRGLGNYAGDEVIDYSGNGADYSTEGMATAASADPWTEIKTERGDDYLYFAKRAASTKPQQVSFNLEKAATAGAIYTFATDFNLISTKNSFNAAGKADPWAAKLAMAGAEEFFAIYAYSVGTKVTLVTSDSEELITLPLNQWVNLQIDYVATGKDGDNYTADLVIKLAGDEVYKTTVATAADNTTYTGAYVATNTTISDAVVGLDNTFINARYTGRGSGIYADLAEKYDALSSVNNNFGSDTFASGNINSVYLVESDNGDKYVELNRTATAGGGATPYIYNHNALNADTYVFETDINFGSEWGGLSGGSGNWGVKLAFKNVSGSTFLPFLANLVLNDEGTAIKTVKFNLFSNGDVAELTPDTWYNFRVKYTPKGYDGQYYRADVSVWIDNELVFRGSNIYVTGDGYLKSSNASFSNVTVELREYSNESTVRFDNTYVGVEGGPAVENTDAELTFKSGNAEKVTKEADGSYRFNVGGVGEQVTYFYDDNNIWGDAGLNTLYTASFNLTVNAFENVNRDWWSYFGFVTNGTGTNVDSRGGFTMNTVSPKDATGQPKLGDKFVLEIGREYEVKLVFRVTAANTALTLQGDVYVDGVFVNSTTARTPAGSTDVIGFFVKTPGSNSYGSNKTNDFTISNLAFKVLGYDDGIVINQSFSADSADATVVGKRTADGFETKSQYVTLKTDVKDATNKVLNFHIAKSADPAIEGDTSWKAGELHTHYLAGDLGQAKVGSIYEVTYRIRINEIKNNATKPRTWWMYAGLLTDTTLGIGNFETGVAMYDRFNASGDTLKIGSEELTTGQWYEMKYVYVVTSLEGGMTFTSTVYLNGVAVGSHKNSYPSSGNGTNIIGFGFKTPSGGSGSFDDLDFDIDDINITAYVK